MVMGVQVAQPLKKVVLKPLASKIFKVLAQPGCLIQGTVMLEIQKLSSSLISLHLVFRLVPGLSQGWESSWCKTASAL